MNKKTSFNHEEQLEIIDILKGVLLYSKKNKNITLSEEYFIDVLVSSCDKVKRVIKDRGQDNEYD